MRHGTSQLELSRWQEQFIKRGQEARKKTSNIKLTTIKTEQKIFNKAVIYLPGKQTQACPLQATRLKFIFPQYKVIGGWRHFYITLLPNSEYSSIVIEVLVMKPELY